TAESSTVTLSIAKGLDQNELPLIKIDNDNTTSAACICTTEDYSDIADTVETVDTEATVEAAEVYEDIEAAEVIETEAVTEAD
ncbi:MAG: hypothetical protein IKM72_12395, partial [Oscillospiraceae bacterium]|nr:hypothetical protein [Oscillospiraceae bacterium]